MDLELRVDVPAYAERNVRSAAAHVFVSGYSEVDVIPVRVGGATPLSLKGMASGALLLPASTIVGVDLFVEESNAAGVWCWQRVGSASIYASDLRRRGTAESPFKHQSSQLTQGGVVASARFTSDLRFAPPLPHEWVPSQQASVSALLEAYVRAETDDLTLEPSAEFLRRVHAPRHYARVAPLPGAAFWMGTPALKADEAWCAHWLKVVCRRHDRTTDWVTQSVVDQFDRVDAASDAFHEVCSMVCEAACGVVNSVAYVSDWVPSRGARLCCESFDEVFVRRSGDCEDGAKGIVEVLRCFQDGAWTTPLLLAVQRVCGLYVPCGVLGMVNAPTVRNGAKQAFQAHMFMNWIPVDRFNAMAGIDAPPSRLPWTRHLRALNGEGTGHVDPSVRPYGAVAPELVEVERTARCQRLPPFVDRMLRPSILGGGGFYHMHAHLYTNELLRRGQTSAPAAFSFVRRSAPGFYGVAYADVMRGDEDVALVPHRPLDEDVVSAIRHVLALEHPLPRMRYVRDAPESTECVALEDYARASRNSAVFTDLYLRPTDLLTRVQAVRRCLQRLGVRALSVVREYDPNGVEFCAVRLRCYF